MLRFPHAAQTKCLTLYPSCASALLMGLGMVRRAQTARMGSSGRISWGLAGALTKLSSMGFNAFHAEVVWFSTASTISACAPPTQPGIVLTVPRFAHLLLFSRVGSASALSELLKVPILVCPTLPVPQELLGLPMPARTSIVPPAISGTGSAVCKMFQIARSTPIGTAKLV